MRPRGIWKKQQLCLGVAQLGPAFPGALPGAGEALLMAYFIPSGRNTRGCFKVAVSFGQRRGQGRRRASLPRKRGEQTSMYLHEACLQEERGVCLRPTPVVRVENRSPFIPNLPQSLTLLLSSSGINNACSAMAKEGWAPTPLECGHCCPGAEEMGYQRWPKSLPPCHTSTVPEIGLQSSTRNTHQAPTAQAKSHKGKIKEAGSELQSQAA